MRYGLEQDNITRSYSGESSVGSRALISASHAPSWTGSALALLARQRSVGSGPDAQTPLDKLLFAEAARTRDPYTRREHLVYDIL
jgi:hypothetical protein